MKRFAWLMMFLALGMFAYTGCGGPPAGQTESSSADDDLAEQDMMGMGGDADGGGDGEMGAPDDGEGDEGGEEGEGEGEGEGEQEDPGDSQ